MCQEQEISIRPSFETADRVPSGWLVRETHPKSETMIYVMGGVDDSLPTRLMVFKM